MTGRPPRSTRTDKLVPYQTLLRSEVPVGVAEVPELLLQHGRDALAHEVRTVLEHHDGSSEVVGGHRGEVVTETGRPIGAYGEDLRQRRRRLAVEVRSEEHTSELQSLMRISYAVFCLTKQQQT